MGGISSLLTEPDRKGQRSTKQILVEDRSLRHWQIPNGRVTRRIGISVGRGAINVFEVLNMPSTASGILDDFYHVLLGHFEEGSIFYKHSARFE